MKSVFMVLAIGALVIGSILTVGLLTENSRPTSNVIYYNEYVPVEAPTKQQFKTAVPQTDSTSSYAVIKIAKGEEGK